MKQTITSLIMLLACLLPQTVWGQYPTYTANGVTWKFALVSGGAEIRGETQGATSFSGALNIPDVVQYNGNNYTVKAIVSYAFNNYVHATSVTIPNSVGFMGYGCFAGSGITSVTLPNNSSLKLESSIFNGCAQLTHITIPDALSPENFEYMSHWAASPFQGCTGLQNITIPNHWTRLPKWFVVDCNNITSFALPASITKIGDFAFYQCQNLTHIDASAATHLTEIGKKAFSYTALTEAVVPEGLTTVGDSAFMFCKNITAVTIPNSITYLGEGAFINCTGLTNATLPPTVTSIPKALFSYCRNLVHCNLSSSLTSIDSRAFAGCTQLREDITHLTNTIFKSACFSDCENITGHITIPEGTQNIGPATFGNCPRLTGTVTFPASVNFIGENAFFKCTGLTGDLTLGENIKTVGKRAFMNAGFTGGTLRVGIQNINGGKVEDHAFRGAGFSHVIVEGEQPVAIGNAFHADRGNEYAWDAANADSKYQITLTIAPEVKKLADYAFDQAYIVGHVNIPSSVTSVGKGAFALCRKLESVSWLATATEIPSGCFEYSSLASISIPNTITKIGDNAFMECKKLTTFDLASSNINFIGDNAFAECSNLVADASTMLPSTITTLGSAAFVGCRKVTGEAILPSPYQIPHPQIGYNYTNPMVGTGCYGIKMGPYTDFFQPAASFNRNTNWMGDQYQNLLYIDARDCTVALTNIKNHANTCYQFSRSADLYNEEYIYCNFGHLAINALVYLPSETLFQNAALPQKTLTERFVYNSEYPGMYGFNGENFIMDGKCQRLYVQDGLDYRVPYAFTAVEARCSRTFTNTTGKAVSTLYLPYPTDLPDGMLAYSLSFKGLDLEGNKAFHFDPLPAGTRLEANHPYLVQITDGQSHKLPTMYNVQVPVSPDIETSSLIATSDNDWKIYGTTERINNEQAYNKKAYYLSANKWWAVRNGEENDFIAPFRCFITSPTGAAPAKSFLMVLHEGTATSINQLEKETEIDIQSGRYEFYSIDGVAMGRDYQKLKSGQIYIVNGKKIYKF